MNGRSSRAGYSLLELITVLGIAGITASLALPGLSYVKERRGGEYDAEYLGGKLRQLRMETLQAEASVRLDILPVENRAGVYRLKAYRSAGNVGRGNCHAHVFETQLYDTEWDLKSGYYVYTDTANGLCFYPGGGSSGGSVYMADGTASYRQLEEDPIATEEPPSFSYLAADMRPADFALVLDPDTVRARIDVPLATGIVDIVKTFTAFTANGESE